MSHFHEHRHYKKNVERKEEGRPVFGPSPPPPVETTPLSPPLVDPLAFPAPPAASDNSPSLGEEPKAVQATIGRSGGRSWRKSLPRKKWGKESKGGWEGGEELPAHPEDVDRYDVDVPWDLRLLRACDEFRSLRSFRDTDYRATFRTLFRFLQADIVQLHQTYGPQPLRGYDPEPDRNYDDSDDGGGEGGDDDPLQEEQLSFSGKSEEEWAEIVFDLGRHAKYFDNRSNDGYAATLTLAPLISTSFLKFLLARKVFPNQSQRIDGCLQVCDAATKHLLPASILYKQLLNHSSLSSAVDRLFPSIDSTLVLPSDASKLDGPSVASSGDAVPQDELGEVEAATNEVKPSPDDERKPSGRDAGKQGGGWKSKGKGKGRASVEGTSKGGAETWSKMASDEANSPFSRLAKQVELDASVRRQWSSPSSTLSSTVDAFLSSAQRLHLLPSASTTGEGEEVEGVWRVGQRELSARTLRGWKVVSGIRTEKKVKQTSGRAGEKSGEDEMGKGADGLLVELQLSEHEDAFPLTTRTERSEIKIGIDEVDNHTLSSPISLIIHLPSTFSLDTLTALKISLLEASLVQLVFVPYSPSSARPSSLWLPSRIHRIIPSYWTTQQELLRDQPLDRSFETSWEGEGEEGSVTVEEIKEKWAREERQREAEAAEEGGEALTSVGDGKGAGCLGKQSGEALTARNNGSELEGEKGTA